MSPATVRTSLFPFLLLAAMSNYECQVNTAAGTGELRIFGTINFVDVDGGCWTLDATNGLRYELRSDQVPEQLRRDGTRVSLIGVERDDWDRVCRVGTMLEVREVAAE